MLITTGKEFSSGFITATSKAYCSTCLDFIKQTETDTIPGLGTYIRSHDQALKFVAIRIVNMKYIIMNE